MEEEVVVEVEVEVEVVEVGVVEVDSSDDEIVADNFEIKRRVIHVDGSYCYVCMHCA